MDSSSEDEILLLVAAAEEDARRRQCIRKRLWVHNMNTSREEQGEFYTLVPQLLKDVKRFYIYFRMTPECFNVILRRIRTDITKQDTNWRRAIPPEERLTIAVRYLATADTFTKLGHSFRVGASTVSAIVKEVCDAIWNNMKEDYMPQPTLQHWETCAQRFEDKWGFPNCVGAVGAKHVTLKSPDSAGAAYFSYLKKHSMVLLGVVGPDNELVCIDVGGYGKNGDGGFFEESIMGRRLNNGEIGLPDDKPLPGQHERIPHVLVGDQAFALTPRIMRPFLYKRAKYDPRKNCFNTILGKVGKVAEIAFGMLSIKFRIFLKPIELPVEKTKAVVSTACLLHNFLRLRGCDEQYIDALIQEDPVEGEIVAVRGALRNPRAANISYAIRDKFADHFHRAAQ